jgi:hypothetical protein
MKYLVIDPNGHSDNDDFRALRGSARCAAKKAARAHGVGMFMKAIANGPGRTRIVPVERWVRAANGCLEGFRAVPC